MITITYQGNSRGPIVLHIGTKYHTKQTTLLLNSLTFYNLNRNTHSLNFGGNILGCCLKTDNEMDDREKRKEVWDYRCQSTYCTVNTSFTYQKPYLHFYWHSPTVYKKYYTRVDQFHIIKLTKKIHKNQYLKTNEEKKKVYIQKCFIMLIKQHKIAIKK